MEVYQLAVGNSSVVLLTNKSNTYAVLQADIVNHTVQSPVNVSVPITQPNLTCHDIDYTTGSFLITCVGQLAVPQDTNFDN